MARWVHIKISLDCPIKRNEDVTILDKWLVSERRVYEDVLIQLLEDGLVAQQSVELVS